MKRIILRLAGATLALAAVGAGAGYWVLNDFREALDAPIAVREPVLLQIEPGQTVTTIAHTLQAQGWLARALYFRIEATRRGVATRLQAGTYEVLPGTTPRELLRKFARGDVKVYQVTFVEGTTFRELRAVLERSPGVVKTPGAQSDEGVMAAVGAPDELPEGRFFPATYYHTHATPDTELLARAYRQMQATLSRLWETRAADLPYATPYDALIMASIIEKETGRPEERGAIAGVFVRRLQQHMKLQTDPTVIYGLGPAFDGNLRRADLERDTPYNTYTRPGLPPTPIAMPGEAAIHAALHPAPGAALYFVARGDGSHAFSATLEAHTAAVRRYQLERE